MLHVRHALMNKSVPSSAKQQCDVTTFTVYLLDSVQTNLVAGFFVNIVKCEQDEIIAKLSWQEYN